MEKRTHSITRHKKIEKKLQNSYEIYRAIFDNTATAIVIAEEDKTISMVNGKFEKLSGYLKNEIENKMRWTDFVFPEDLLNMEEYHRARRKEKTSITTEYEFRAKDKHGNIKHIFMKVDLIPGTKKSIASMIDITGLKDTEKKLLYRIEIEKLINSISTRFISVSSKSLDAEINRLLREVGKFTNIDCSYIFLFSEEGEIMSNTHEWCARGILPQIHNLQKLPSSIFPWWMKKLNQNQVIHVPDVDKMSFQANAEKETLQAQNIQSFLVFPISNSIKLIGFIGFNAVRCKKCWAEEDIALLRTLGNIITGAVKRVESEEKLKKTINATIETMSKIIDTRDAYTSGHQHRVSHLAMHIARNLKLDHDIIEGIRIASLIHDIGKIGIPSEILTKAGALSDIEFSLIKNHSQSGYDILKGIDFPYPIAKIVLQHHERINGSGYPNHLKGDGMLLEAKIIGVADVVEAMTSHRPYRAALGIEAALEEISKNEGILYEPEIVDACVKLFREEGFNLK